jgi:hypothetical protein
MMVYTDDMKDVAYKRQLAWNLNSVMLGLVLQRDLNQPVEKGRGHSLGERGATYFTPPIRAK